MWYLSTAGKDSRLSKSQPHTLKAKQSWTYAVLLMSVGPVGPGGGVYSIVEVVVSNQSNYMSVVKKN